MTPNEIPNSSPKRKRNTIDSTNPEEASEPSPKAPRLNIDVIRDPLEEDEIPGGSPRSRVANKLEGLHLKNNTLSRTLVFRSEPSEAAGSMDMKEPPIVDYGEKGSKQDEKRANIGRGYQSGELVVEQVSQPLGKETIRGSRPHARRKSPPPPATSIKAHPENAGEYLESAYWEEGEITGHTVGLEDPEEDLEGLNGVGFRPSRAQSYARTMKRRKQILDYKTREAKEARQKRSERRRRVEEVFVETERARKVRFAVENG